MMGVHLSIRSVLSLFVLGLLFCVAPDGVAQTEEEPAEFDAPDEADPRRKIISGVLERLRSDDPKVSNEAGVALLEMATVEDLPWLVQGLKQGGSTRSRVLLIEILGALGDTRAAKTLRFEVEYGEPAIQLAATRALGHIKHNWVVPIILKVLSKGESIELRQAAAAALGRLGTGDAKYALQSVASSKDLPPGVRNAVAWSLAHIEKKIDEREIDKTVGYGRKAEYYFRGTRYRLYTPGFRPKKGPKPRLLVCVHDRDLEIDPLFESCSNAAKERSLAALVPLFDPMRFPDYNELNYRGERADRRLDELVDHVAQDADLETHELYLFGIGAGGDFVQRYAFAHPERIARAAFRATEYTMPDEKLLFPEGIGLNLRAPDLRLDAAKFIKSDLAVIQSTDRAQNRLSNRFLEALSEVADAGGLTSRIAVRQAAGDVEVWTVGSEYLFRAN